MKIVIRMVLLTIVLSAGVRAQTAEQKVAAREAIQKIDSLNHWDNQESAGFRLLFIQPETATELPDRVVLAKPVELEPRSAQTRLRWPRLAVMVFDSSGGRNLFIMELDCTLKTLKYLQINGQPDQDSPRKVDEGSYADYQLKFACDPKKLHPYIKDEGWKQFTGLTNVNY